MAIILSILLNNTLRRRRVLPYIAPGPPLLESASLDRLKVRWPGCVSLRERARLQRGRVLEESLTRPTDSIHRYRNYHRKQQQEQHKRCHLYILKLYV